MSFRTFVVLMDTVFSLWTFSRWMDEHLIAVVVSCYSKMQGSSLLTHSIQSLPWNSPKLVLCFIKTCTLHTWTLETSCRFCVLKLFILINICWSYYRGPFFNHCLLSDLIFDNFAVLHIKQDKYQLTQMDSRDGASRSIDHRVVHSVGRRAWSTANDRRRLWSVDCTYLARRQR